MICYHLDENVNPAVANQLRHRGIEVSISQEAGLLQFQDSDQLAWSTRHGRVLFTHDADLLRLHAIHPNHSGIVYAKPLTLSLGEIVRGLVLIHELLTEAEMIGRLEFLPKVSK